MSSLKKASLPVMPGKHVIADGQELHYSFVQMKILKTFEQERMPTTNRGKKITKNLLQSLISSAL